MFALERVQKYIEDKDIEFRVQYTDDGMPYYEVYEANDDKWREGGFLHTEDGKDIMDLVCEDFYDRVLANFFD